MAFSLHDLDAHEQPSDEMRAEWKTYSKMDSSILQTDPRIDDPQLPISETGFRTAGTISKDQIAKAVAHLQVETDAGHDASENGAPILYHPILPGLLIIPNLLSPRVQTRLLDLLVHRDLSNPQHQTNLHLHYDLPYLPSGESIEEGSFFNLDPEPSLPPFTPKDPSVHKPLTPQKVFGRRLHWVTLGGQYDWTNRMYPDAPPPGFPPDIAGFLETLFPETLAQAAIVNFYSPGDTMMMHRDVSEEANRGLVSLSIGCDGLFMIAPSGRGVENGTVEDAGGGEQQPSPDTPKGKGYLLLRLRSGDGIYMTGESRYAWHGVPKILKDTCPSYLEDWPAGGGRFEEWSGWMKTKRINLNVRQVKD